MGDGAVPPAALVQHPAELAAHDPAMVGTVPAGRSGQDCTLSGPGGSAQSRRCRRRRAGAARKRSVHAARGPCPDGGHTAAVLVPTPEGPSAGPRLPVRSATARPGYGGIRPTWHNHSMTACKRYDYAKTVGKDCGRIEIRWGGVIGGLLLLHPGASRLMRRHFWLGFCMISPISFLYP